MNILVDSDGLAWVLVKNDDPISARQDGLFIGNPVHSIFSVGAAEDWAVVSSEEVPNDWQPGRYFLIEGEWSLNVDWQEPLVEPPPIPQSVSMRQARLALLSYGLLDDVDSVIIAMTEPQRSQTQIEWEYAQTVERENALVAALGPALGLDDAAINGLFTLAATL